MIIKCGLEALLRLLSNFQALSIGKLSNLIHVRYLKELFKYGVAVDSILPRIEIIPICSIGSTDLSDSYGRAFGSRFVVLKVA